MVGERIRLVAEAIMPRSKRVAVEPSETMKKLVDEAQGEVRRRLVPGSTFEQRRAAAAALS